MRKGDGKSNDEGVRMRLGQRNNEEEEVIEKTNENDVGDWKDVTDRDAKEDKKDIFFIIFNIISH